MLDDIIYDSLFLIVETDKDTSSNPIAAYSYDGVDYDFSASGGETSFVFID